MAFSASCLGWTTYKNGSDYYFQADKKIALIHASPSFPIAFRNPAGGFELKNNGDGTWSLVPLSDAQWASISPSLTASDFDIVEADFNGNLENDLLLVSKGSAGDSFVISGNYKTLQHFNGTELNSTILASADTNGDGTYSASELNAVINDNHLPSTPLSANLSGLTAGQFRVDESGSATYSVPLTIPGGRTSVQPSISLDYSSANKSDGIAGIGWSLSASSSIYRCPKNIAQEGAIGGVTYSTADRLCLDGQKLFVKGYVTQRPAPSDATYWAANQTYVTEIASGIEVHAVGTLSTGSGYLYAETKAGERQFYGRRSEANAKLWTSVVEAGQHASVVSSWLRDVVADRLGNAVLYDYQQPQQGEVLPKRISYTAMVNTSSGLVSSDGNNQVVFQYADRSYPESLLSYGTIINKTKYLTNVLVYDDGELWRSYNLYYDAATSVDKATTLASVQECTPSVDCLAPLAFDWQKSHPKDAVFQTASTISVENGDQANNYFMDFDGDGNTDLLYLSNGKWYLRSNITGSPVLLTNSTISSPEKIKFIDWNGDGTMDILASINGVWNVLYYSPTQRKDIKVCNNPDLGRCTIVIPASATKSYNLNIPSKGLEAKTFVADFDGDGLQDILFVDNGVISGYKNKVENGIGFSGSKKQTLSSNRFGMSLNDWDVHSSSIDSLDNMSLVDVNGDGLTDLLLAYTMTVGTCKGYPDEDSEDSCSAVDGHWQEYTSTSLGVWIANGQGYDDPVTIVDENHFKTIMSADFNGDGLTDFLYRNLGGWSYIISLGDGHFTKPKLISIYGDDSNFYKVHLADINGDGRTDIIFPGSSGNDAYINYAYVPAGSTTVDFTGSTFQAGLKIEDYFQFADIDNDGQIDAVSVLSGSLKVYKNFRAGLDDNVITAFNTDSAAMGTKTTVTYGQLNDSDVYFATDSNNATNDGVLRRLGPSTMKVVSKVTSDAPANSSVSVAYSYGGGLLHTQGRGFLGFEVLATKDLQRNVTTKTNYNQIFPLTGTPASTSKVTNDGTLLSESITLYPQDGSIPAPEGSTVVNHQLSKVARNLDSTGGYVVYPAYTRDISYALDGSGASVTEQSSDQDTYGNVLYSATATYFSTTPHDVFYRELFNSYSDARFGRLTCAAAVNTRAGGSPVGYRLSACDGMAPHADRGKQSITKVSHFTYNGNLLLATEQVDGLYLKSYSYDSYGNISRSVTSSLFAGEGSLSQVEEANYSDRGLISDKTVYGVDKNGTESTHLTTQYRYNGTTAAAVTGIISQVTTIDANNVSSSQYSDALDRVVKVVDAYGKSQQTSYGMCTSGCPSGARYYQHSFGDQTPDKYSYFNKFGLNVQTATKTLNPQGTYGITHTSYDRFARVVTASEPVLNASPSYNVSSAPYSVQTYDLFDRVLTQTDPRKYVSRFAYSLGKTTQTNAKGYNAITLSNASGETTETIDQRGQKVDFIRSVDGSGLLTSTDVTAAFGSSASNTVGVSRSHTNIFGQADWSADLNKGASASRYDAFGNMVQAWDINLANNASLDAQRDAALAVLAGGSVVATDDKLWIAYDGLGRKVGQKSSKKLGSSYQVVTQCWAYDTASNGKGKVASSWQTTSTETTESSTIACSGAANSEWVESYQYNGKGQPVLTTTTIDGKTYTAAQSYDGYGRVQYQSLPGTAKAGVEYVYDSNGFLSQRYQFAISSASASGISGSRGNLIDHNELMDARGNITTQSLGNGLTNSRIYGGDTGFIKTIAVSSGSANKLQVDYGFDSLGNLESRTWNTTHFLLDSAGWIVRRDTYQYDSLNRLTQASVNYDPLVAQDPVGEECGKNLICVDDPTDPVSSMSTMSLASTSFTPIVSPPNSEETYSYDGAGNFLKKGSISDYTYDAANPYRMTRANGRTYQYDNNGNVTSDGVRQFSYNAADRVTQITQGSSVTSFRYGPGQVRFARTDTRVVDGKTVVIKTLSVGGMERITETTNGSVTSDKERYDFGDAIQTHYISTGVDSVSYLHKDYQGSIIAVSDSSGVVQEQRFYDPWGKATATKLNGDTGPLLWFTKLVTNRGYTGHEQLPDMDLIHMNGRIYDSTVGRFMQADPLVQAPGNLQNYNRYSYVMNNPMTLTDPSGFLFGKIGKFFKKNWKTLAAIAVGYVTFGLGTGIWSLTNMGNLALGQAIGWGAVAGATSGFVATGSLRGAAYGALSGAVFGGLGMSGLKGFDAFAVSGLAGGVLSTVQGGKFGNGFISAGIGAAVGGQFGANPYNQVLGSAVVGGTVSVLTGDKFANGAVSAAFAAALRAEWNSETRLDGNGEPGDISNDVDVNSILRKGKLSTSYLGDNHYGVDVNATIMNGGGLSTDEFSDEVSKIENAFNGSYKIDSGAIIEIHVSLSVVNSGGDFSMSSCGDYVCFVGGKPGSGFAYVAGKEITLATHRSNLTSAHEFGHILGFHHQANLTNSLMSYSEQRSLTGNDAFRLFKAYREAGY
ncbi:RHS repeat-associated protein [Gallaecimonas pentaromativorans]|uniref:RHS repeat-associated protein n=2 Tax=Gallaecimonas pentaromativorans TaxID=584787 RepID=A0A3N1P8I0_9GAMM|nr:RHS repeat-associated protein [Gallaecimonas pentaromativorans]